MKRLIVNADDFGLTESVNQGIIKGFEEGVITSTTLMASAPAFDSAVDLAKSHPKLGLGVHLTLTQLHPVSAAESIASLLGSDGVFYTLPAFARRISTGRLSSQELKTELTAQLEKVCDTGLRPDHLDCHQHVHIFPDVFHCLVDLAKTFHIPAVRTTQAWSASLFGCVTKDGLKRWLLSRYSKRYKDWLKAVHFRTVDYFWGTESLVESKPLEIFLNIAGQLQEGDHELMCHAGFVSDELRALDSYVERRERELMALCDPVLKAAMTEHGIDLICYRDL